MHLSPDLASNVAGNQRHSRVVAEQPHLVKFRIAARPSQLRRISHGRKADSVAAAGEAEDISADLALVRESGEVARQLHEGRSRHTDGRPSSGVRCRQSQMIAYFRPLTVSHSSLFSPSSRQ